MNVNPDALARLRAERAALSQQAIDEAAATARRRAALHDAGRLYAAERLTYAQLAAIVGHVVVPHNPAPWWPALTNQYAPSLNIRDEADFLAFQAGCAEVHALL